jgi:hypothetical protein
MDKKGVFMEEQHLEFLEDTLRNCLAEYMNTPDDETEVVVKIALNLYKNAAAGIAFSQPVD